MNKINNIRTIDTKVVGNPISLLRDHDHYNFLIHKVIDLMRSFRNGNVPGTPEQKNLVKRYFRLMVNKPIQNYEHALRPLCSEPWKATKDNQPGHTMKGYSQYKKVGGKRVVDEEAIALIDQIQQLSLSGYRVFNIKEFFGDIPKYAFEIVLDQAFAYIKSYYQSRHRWFQDKEKFENNWAKWSDSKVGKNFLEIKPHIDEFRKNNNLKKKSKYDRWDAWMEFMKNTPALLGWEKLQKTPVLQGNDIKKIKNFYDANPTLDKLAKALNYYEKNFVLATNKNKERVFGYTRQPSFTNPDVINQPQFLVYPRDKCYYDLVMPTPTSNGNITLQLLSGAVETFEFTGDKRLQLLEETGDGTYFYHDNRRPQPIPARMKGAKLDFRNVVRDNDGNLIATTSPSFSFTWELLGQDFSEKAKAIEMPMRTQEEIDIKLYKPPVIPNGLWALSVDARFDNNIFVTWGYFKKNGKFVQVRSAKAPIFSKDYKGPIYNFKKIENLLKLRQKQSGKQYPEHLADHFYNMRNETQKRYARAIIDLALNLNEIKDKKGKVIPKVDVILIEKLDFKRSIYNSKATNRAFAKFSPSKVQTIIEEIAHFNNMKVFTVHPAGSSQICNQCGSVGVRFDRSKDEVSVGFLKKSFFCPHCGYIVNADFNATMNIAGLFANRATYGKKYFDACGREDKKEFFDNLKENAKLLLADRFV